MRRRKLGERQELKPPIFSSELRGAEAPLFHGGASIRITSASNHDHWPSIRITGASNRDQWRKHLRRFLLRVKRFPPELIVEIISKSAGASEY